MFLSQKILNKTFLLIFILLIFSSLYSKDIATKKSLVRYHYYLVEMQERVERTNLNMFATKFKNRDIHIVDISDYIVIIKSTENGVNHFLNKYALLINHVYRFPLHKEMKSILSYSRRAQNIALKWNHQAKKLEKLRRNLQTQKEEKRLKGEIPDKPQYENRIKLENSHKKISNLLSSLRKEHFSTFESLKRLSGESKEKKLLERQKEILEIRISSLNKKLLTIQDKLEKLRHIKDTKQKISAEKSDFPIRSDRIIFSPKEPEVQLEIALKSLKKIRMQATGKITGKVTGSSGESLSSATVRAYDLNYTYMGFDMTDSSGNYEITDLPTGTYRVYCYTYSQNYLPEWYNDKSSFDTADNVSVTDGSTTSGIDVQLAEGGIISGTVTSASASSTIAANGSGIENVRVKVYDASQSYRSYNYVAYATTDSSGNYNVQQLPTGTYRVYFDSYSNELNYIPEWYNDKSSFDTADDVSVTAGSTTANIDAQLAEGGIISGTVTSASASSTIAANGSGIENVRVKLYDASQSYSSSKYIIYATTDSSGNYNVQGLPGGTYRVYFDPSEAGNYISEWYNDKSSFDTADDVSVTAGSTTSGIDALLAVGGIISGTVTSPSATGIHKAEGPGAEDVWVEVYDLDKNYIRGAYTDSSGNYQIQRLTSGTYRVYFDPSEAGNYISEWYNDKSSFDTADDVSVTAGSTTSGIDALLAVGGIISGTVTSASATGIHKAADTGIEDVLVRVYDLNYNNISSTLTDSSGKYTIKCLPGGTYRVYFNAYSAGNYLSEWYNDKSSFDTADDVSVTAGSPTPGIDAQLTVGGIISGTVTSASATGIHKAADTGIEDVWVGVYDLDEKSIGDTYTDSSGNYQIQRLTSGTYRVKFSPSGGNYLSEWYNDKSSFDTADDVSVTAGSTTSGINAQLAVGGIISGTVTSASAALAANGLAIENVRVKACVPSQSYLGYYIEAYATTDSSGNYQIHGLPTGNYRVYFDSYYNDLNYIPEWYNDKSSFDTADDVSVTAGSTTSGINAQLAVGGIISGTVTSASATAVLKASSSGIEDVYVRAYDLNENYITYDRTDSSGNYQIQGLPAGTYRIKFSAPYAENYILEWHNDKSSFDTADDVSVTAGSTTSGINAQLTVGGIISGTVTSASATAVHKASSSGIEDVYVRAYDLDENYITTAFTDSSGNYQIQGLPTGNYRVYFYAYYAGNYVSEWYNDKASFDTADDVSVTAGSTTSDIDAQLAAGGIVSGTITSASAAGINTADGSGIKDVRARVYDLDENYITSDRTDSSGNYQIQGLPSGNYRVNFDSSDAGNYLSEWYNDKASFDSADDVSVTAGSTTSGIDAQLEVGSIISGTVTSASASRINTANGSGIENVRVKVYDASKSYSESSYVAYVTTDSSGNYQIQRLPAGTYRVYFDSYYYKLNYVPEWYNDKSSFYEGDNISVTAGSTTSGINAQLGVGGTISGKVTGLIVTAGIKNKSGSSSITAESGIEDVYIYIYDQYGNYASVYGLTKSDGSYTVQGIPTGKYKVIFDAWLKNYDINSNYATEFYNNVYKFSEATDISVSAGATTSDINAQLETGSQITGTVQSSSSGVSSAGSGLNGASIRAWQQDLLIYQSATSGSDGTYTLKGLSTTGHYVRFSKSGYIRQYYNNKLSLDTADLVSTVVGTTVSGIDATMETGATISGRVTDNSDQGISNVYVRFCDGDGNIILASASTNTLGDYTANVPAGTWKVLFDGQYTTDNYGSKWYNNKNKLSEADSVSVTLGESMEGINAVLVPGGGIEGRVTALSNSSNINIAQNKGINSVKVKLKDEDDNIFLSTTTSDGGYYTLKGIPEGTYKVYFDPPKHLGEVTYSGMWYNNKYSFADANNVSVSAGAITPDINATLYSGPGAEISLSRSSINFGSTTTEIVTSNQQFIISNAGGGTLDWSISDDAAWLSCAPNSGLGNAVITVSVDSSGLTAGTYNATISISSSGASNSPQQVNVTLTVYKSGTTDLPFGYFDTPADGTTGITGAVAATGWVLDDIEVTKLEIKRDAHPSDSPAAIGRDGLVYIGDAVFVEGPRPDIEQAYPGYPFNYKAGWGYMLLTNFLPNQGNGTFRIHALVYDKEGHKVSLGTKTITCDNANAILPFGTIDTPGQGGEASGNAFLNWGWVLTPQPNSIPTDGSTILVWIDGVAVGNIDEYNLSRADITALFPGFANTDGAVGYYRLDTTQYSNGVYTLAWSARDSAGNVQGIGSRYFTIINTQAAAQAGMMSRRVDFGAPLSFEVVGNLPLSFEPVRVWRGYTRDVEPEVIATDNYGGVSIEIREVERVELDLGKGMYTGYMIVGDQLRPLPIGSTLDTESGTFSWQPGPGFIGEYDLVFLMQAESGLMRRIRTRIRILPKFSLR